MTCHSEGSLGWPSNLSFYCLISLDFVVRLFVLVLIKSHKKNQGYLCLIPGASSGNQHVLGLEASTRDDLNELS